MDSIQHARTPGRRRFIVACALTALFGLGHLLSFLSSARTPPSDAGYQTVANSMTAYRIPLGPASPSMMDVALYFSLTFSILHFLAAGLSLAAVGLAADRARAVRMISLLNCAFLAPMLGAAVFYRIPPGWGGSGIALVLFLSAAVSAGGAKSTHQNC